MTRTILLAAIPLAVLGLFGCEPRQPSPTPPILPESFRVDDALPPEEFAAGWKAIPGSYIYSASEDELWKIYNGAAPGVIHQGGREAVTQAYEKSEGGADESFRVFILRFVDKAHALTYLKKEIEGASSGQKLNGVDAGQIFDKGKAPWVRSVVGRYLISINWEGSDDDTDDTTLEAVRTISAKLAAGR